MTTTITPPVNPRFLARKPLSVTVEGINGPLLQTAAFKMLDHVGGFGEFLIRVLKVLKHKELNQSIQPGIRVHRSLSRRVLLTIQLDMGRTYYICSIVSVGSPEERLRIGSIFFLLSSQLRDSFFPLEIEPSAPPKKARRRKRQSRSAKMPTLVSMLKEIATLAARLDEAIRIARLLKKAARTR